MRSGVDFEFAGSEGSPLSPRYVRHQIASVAGTPVALITRTSGLGLARSTYDMETPDGRHICAGQDMVSAFASLYRFLGVNI